MKGKKKPEDGESDPVSDEYGSQSEYSSSELENMPSRYYFDVWHARRNSSRFSSF